MEELSYLCIYTYKGQQYEIVVLDGKMKNPQTKEWQDAITYISVSDGAVYTREKADFEAKFKYEFKISD